MAVAQLTYAAEAAITITLTSLASSATAGRESAEVDNTSNRYIDALVFLATKLAAGTPGNDRAIYVFAWGSLDSTHYPDAITGADAAITFNDPVNIRLIGVINAPTSAGTYKGGPFSIAQAFGGVMPPYWGIAVRNYTGIALSSTAGDHEASFVGIELDIT